MTKKPVDTVTLLDSQQALHVYLDSLLSEIDFTDDVVSTNTDLNAEAVSGLGEEYLEPREQTNTEKPVGPLVAPVAEFVDANERAIPQWADKEFQSLSFQVAGLTLAAPLDKLNGIVELNEELTALPGYASWVLGVLNNRGQNVQVIDIGQIANPGQYAGKNTRSNNHCKYVVLVGGGNYGLAADSLSQVLTLSPDDVRWRGVNSKRPWLAGTVIEQMCAILDIDQLCVDLEAGQKPAN